MFKGQKYTKEQALKLVAECYDNGEPVFIVKGRDKISWETVKWYAERLKEVAGLENHGEASYNLAEAAEKYASAILLWQRNNREKVKLPD